MRAGRTLDSTITRLSGIDASRIVPTPSSFKHLDVPEYTDSREKLLISVLKTISYDMKPRSNNTYLYPLCPCIISFVIQSIIKVMCRKFALKGNELKRVEHVKGESGLGMVKHCRE